MSVATDIGNSMKVQSIQVYGAFPMINKVKSYVSVSKTPNIVESVLNLVRFR